MSLAIPFLVLLCIAVLVLGVAVSGGGEGAAGKPDPETALQMLKDGNKRFHTGNAEHPHSDGARLALADTVDQGKYAYATVLSCSDSRVPVEMIFDAGIMDLFVVRVAGNVCDTDEIGTIEYGIGLHVGDVTYGNIGTGNRLEFTVIGEAANLAARIESLCKLLGESVLVSAEFAACAPDRVTSLGDHELKGIEEPQEIYTLL